MNLGGRFRRGRFERRVQAQLPALYRTARGLTQQPADAEDLVHDACVKALAAFGSVEFCNEQALGGWLQRILINTYRDRYRRAVRSPVRPATGSSQTHMYRSGSAWVSLYIMKSGPNKTVTGRNDEANLKGYSYIGWTADGLHYTLVGEVSNQRLRHVADELQSVSVAAARAVAIPTAQRSRDRLLL